jgi:large subunit ribosomal protein L31
MKEGIHPTWYSEATVICACGNTWKTGATRAEIRTDICSRCHPFYTGEQRIVDTEGQVDRFMKRLQVRDQIREEAVQRETSKTPPQLPLAEAGVNKRYLAILEENGITNVEQFLNKLRDDGDASLFELQGMGRKALSDIKKLLRNRGYEVPTSSSATETAVEE